MRVCSSYSPEYGWLLLSSRPSSVFPIRSPNVLRGTPMCFKFARLDYSLMPLATTYTTSGVVIALFYEYSYGSVLPTTRFV